MTKKILLSAVATLILASVLPAEAQQPAKITRIGYLDAVSLSVNAALFEAFRQGLMKQIIPKLSRVAVFGSSTSPGNAQSLREVDLAARAFKVQLQYLDVLDPKDIETAFRAASNGRADGVLVLNSPVFAAQRPQIAELAVKSRLPAIFSDGRYVEDGGFMCYGTS